MGPLELIKRMPRYIIGVTLSTAVGALQPLHAVDNAPAPDKSEIQSEHGNRKAAGSAPADKAESMQRRSISTTDSTAMRNIAKANMAEIQMSGFAQAVSENPVIRTYAQKMLDEHGAALQELRSLAKLKGVILPGGPDEAHVSQLRKLALLRGNDFNQQYIAVAGMEAHKQSHALYKEIAGRAEDPDLKKFAAAQLPLIDRHLALGQQTQQNYAPTSSPQK